MGKKDKKGIVRLGILGICIFMFVVVITTILLSIPSSAILNKNSYVLGEKVKINLEGVKGYRLKIITPSTEYVLKKGDKSIIFKPKEVGNYKIVVNLPKGQEIYEFEVIEGVASEPLLNNNSGVTPDIGEATVKEKFISQRKKEIAISSSNGENYQGIKARVNISGEVRHKELIEVYWKEGGKYVDFEALDEDNDGLLDSVEWISSGSENQTFEISIKILNVQSYPVVGGNWTVEFITLGNADLYIRAFNRTTWSDIDENSDLKFLEIKCGNESLDYQWINGSVFIQDYECNETGTEISKVLTSGKHHLEFIFGDEKAYAHNNAADYQLIGEIGETNVSDSLNWSWIFFSNSYASAPVVIATPVSYTNCPGTCSGTSAGNGGMYPIPLVKDVTITGFNLSMCIDGGSTTCTTGASSETFNYFVFDVDAVSSLSWIDVGTVTNVATDGTDTNFNFGHTFTNAPALFVSANTYNQGGNISPIAWADNSGTSTTGGQILGCVHQAPGSGSSIDVCEPGQPAENFSYVAIDLANANFSNSVNFQSGSADISNSAWTAASFSPGYTNPRAMATQNDDDGGQDPQYAWAGNVTFSGMNFRYCEEDAGDVCNTHTSELVYWFAMEDGDITLGGTGAPQVTIISPQNTTYNAFPILFNVTTDEPASVFYSLDGGINNISMIANASNTGFTASNDSIADGVYNFSVYANDSLGNNNFTEFAEFSVDTASPYWFDLNASNSTPDVGASVSFWVYWSDSLNLQSWIFSWNATSDGSFENVSSGVFSGIANISNTTQTIPGVASGKVVGYRFYANDSAGNSNTTTTGVIDVQQPQDSEAPAINSFNVTPETDGYGQNFTIQANVTDNIAIYSVQANISYPNGSIIWVELDLIGGDIYEKDFSDSWQWGDYSFNIYANDSAGNSNTSAAFDDFYVRANATVLLKTKNDIYGANQDVQFSGGSAGDWLYDEWAYRIPISVTENSGSNLTDFQVNLSVDTQTLISQGKMQSACQDMRFGNQNGSFLPYWIESGCNTTSTLIWVETNLTASQSKNIHIYYGNPGAGSESNKNNTLFVAGEAGFLEVAGTDININLQRNYSNPKVFAVPTLNSGVSRTGGVTTQHHLITEVNSGNFSIRQVESSTGGDATIDLTNVTYIVFEEGRYFLGLRNIDIDVGTTTSSGSYSTINFALTFSSTPAVLADTQTNLNGANQIYARGDNLGTSSVQLQVEDDDTTTPSLGSAETIAYAAIAIGADSFNNLETSTVSGITQAFTAQTFSNSYSTTPRVVTHLNDEAGSNSFYSLARAITTSNFEISGEEPASWDGSHTTEIMSWLAVEDGLIYGAKYAGSNPTSSVGSEEEQTNVLENIGSTNISGYMLMQILRNGTDEFISTQVDDSNTLTRRNINSGDTLELSSIWNSNAWDTDSESAGYYKVVAWLTDLNGNYLLNDAGQNITNEYVFFLDITPPTWSNFGANVSEANPLESVLFNATWDDNGALDRWEFWWNASGSWGNVRNGTFSSTPGDSSTTEQIPSAAENSNFSFYFKAYDTTGAANTTNNGSLFIRDITPPSISNEQPNPSTMNRNDGMTISADVTDDDVISRVWAYIRIPNGSAENITMPYILGNLYRANYQSTEIGQYNATVYANDSSGNMDSGSTLMTWDVFGKSNVNFESPTGGSFALGSVISAQCSVQDADTSDFIANYPVRFYANNNFLGENVTNSSGRAVYAINTAGYSEGSNLLNCTIADNATLYYNANIDNSDVSVNILYPQVDVLNLTHENLYETGFNEYEAGDLLEAVNVTVNNTGGATAFGVNVTLRFTDINGDETSWSESEVQSCGDLAAGATCQIDFTNSSSGYSIGQDEFPGNYFFNLTVEWFNDGSGNSYNSSFSFFLHQPQNNFSSTLQPGKVIQNNSAIYNFTIVNPWSSSLNEVNVTITCPDENISCVCLGTANDYCNLTSISGGASKTASFNLSTNSSTLPEDYVVNATVRYTDPSSEFTQWDEKQNRILQVRGPTPFRVNITEFTVNVTRGLSYNLSGLANNTGVSSVSNVLLIWEIPSGWINISGNLTEFNDSLGAGTLIYNNITANITLSSALGQQEIELRANSTEVSDDFQKENIFVYSDSFITSVSSNNSNPFRNESVVLEGLIEHDNSTGISGASLNFYIGNQLLGSNITNSSGTATFSGLVPYNLPLGINTVNVTHDGSSIVWTNPSLNDSITVNVRDEILIENVSASPSIIGYSGVAIISANVSGRVAIGDVRANITYPNGSNTLVQMSFVSGDRYQENFTDSWQWGDYNYTIIANNTAGFSNETSLLNQFFVRTNLSLSAVTDKDTYFQNKDVLLSHSEWWNVSWAYKQFFNITNNYSEDLHEYQVEISIDTPTLFNTGKIRSDCGDVRFTWYNSTLSSEEEIDYYIESCNVTALNSTFWAKVPHISASLSREIYMYYGNDNATTTSSIENTFSYSEPRIVGYVTNERMDNSNGGIISLASGNTIKIGTATFNLGDRGTSGVTASDLAQGNNISATKLFHIESSATSTDTISPVSWAGTEFYYYSNRGTNQFGIVSPFGNATVKIYNGGTEVPGSPFSVNKSNPQLINADITDGNVVRVSSDIPVLVEHYATSEDYDSILYYPATTDYLYGIPSNYLEIGSGPNGAQVQWFTNGTGSGSTSLTANTGYSLGGLGSDGAVSAYRVNGSQPICVDQLADSDGTEATTFLPFKELGTRFGSYYSLEYIAVAAPLAGTSCTVYNSGGSPIETQTAPSVSDEVHKLCFGCGSDTQYATGGWTMNCTQPVYAYYEEDGNDEETQLWSWKQMRQYVYPEPVVNLGSERQTSRTVNNRNFSTSVYVIMEVQTNSSGSWETINTEINDTDSGSARKISSNGGILDLMSIYNPSPWNTELNATGDYRIYITFTDQNGNLLQDDDGSFLNVSAFFEIRDVIPPDVTLLYPSNTTNFANTFLVPNFTFSVAEDLIDSCQLYGDWGTGWHENQTITSPLADDTPVNFSGVDVGADGYYIWNVRCNDTSGNIGWESFNFTFSAFFSPDKPVLINISQSENNGIGNVTLFWNSSNHTYTYRVYQSSDLAGSFSLLGETSDLNFTDTNFSGNIRRFYRVDAFNPTDQNKSLDYFGAHVYSLRHNGNTRNWIGFPTNASYLITANDSLNEIINVTTFTMWNSTIQKRVTCNDFSCPDFPSCTETNCNFALKQGLGYETNLNTSAPTPTNWSLVGIVYNRTNINLIKNATDFGKNWIAIYANTTLTNAQSILENITNSDATTNWDATSQTSQGLIPNPLPFGPPYLGTNFNIDIERAYEVSVTQNTLWKQA